MNVNTSNLVSITEADRIFSEKGQGAVNEDVLAVSERLIAKIKETY